MKKTKQKNPQISLKGFYTDMRWVVRWFDKGIIFAELQSTGIFHISSHMTWWVTTRQTIWFSTFGHRHFRQQATQNTKMYKGAWCGYEGERERERDWERVGQTLASSSQQIEETQAALHFWNKSGVCSKVKKSQFFSPLGEKYTGTTNNLRVNLPLCLIGISITKEEHRPSVFCWEKKVSLCV